MKKLLIFLLPGLILAGGGVAAAGQYNTYQDKQDAVHQAEVKKQAAIVKAKDVAEATVTKLSTAYSAVNIECQKGLASYNALTPVVRTQKKLPAPVCGPAVVQ